VGEKEQLDILRAKLDKLDNEIFDSLNERMKVVHEVGVLKAKTGGAIYRPEREKEIISRFQAHNIAKKGLLDANAIESMFLEIFAISRNLELPENIAYLGHEGSYTHEAAQSRFGAMSSYLPVNSIKGIFSQVENKNAKFGVVPIENSSNGIVHDSIQALMKYDLKIIAELVLDIHHVLASTCLKVEEIKTIYSKDIAIDQCSKFLENLGLDCVEFVRVESTTKAAKLATQNPSSAAICSRVGAKNFSLPILFENIEDIKSNKTRFIIISNFENAQSSCDKTSIIAKVANTHGALVSFLNDFDKAKINLTKIKSHIIQGISWHFIDFDGHKNDDNVKKIFDKYKDNIKFLGSYVKEIDDI